MGDYVQGQREGFGVYKHSNGDIYEGEWMNNLMHGKGKYTWTTENRSTEG